MRDLDGFVFIVTYGRSGSTLLQNMLNAIPGYLVRGENDNILYHLAKVWMTVRDNSAFANRRKELGKDLPDKPVGTLSPPYGTPADPYFGAERVDAGVLGKRLATVFTNQVLKPEPDTRVTGFKEIRFHLTGDDMERYLDFMRFFFPRSRLIFNTRNLADVKNSGWWAQYSQDDFMAEVGEADRRFRSYAQKHPRRSMLMHYDEYKNDPEAFRPLFDFLGETYDRQRVEAVMSQKLDHAKAAKTG